MNPKPTNLSLERIASNFNITPAAVGKLFRKREWLFTVLAAIACDRYGLRSGDADLFTTENGALVRLVVIAKELNLAPPGMKSRRCFKPDAFVAYYTTRVVGAIVATERDFWFAASRDILDWHGIGILKDGAVKRDKALRLLAAMPDEGI